MSYQALVVKAKLRPHPNADRLQLMDVGGLDVAVGLDVKPGQLMVWFPPDGQLSEDMAEANNLVRKILPDGSRDPNSGLFDENRRVRAMNLRSVKSNGYACELDALAWTGADLGEIRAGMSFAELNGKPVCNKYISPATMRARRGSNPMARKANPYFAQWHDTDQLRYKVGEIQPGSIIWPTLKMHGTSHRVGNVIDDEGMGWWQRIGQRLFGATPYNIVHGSRRVVLRNPKSGGYHGSNEFRWEATRTLAERLPRGFVAYGEIVGFDSGGRPIMGAVDTKVLPKQYRKRYGDSMVYRYGQPDGCCSFYLYALTTVGPDGEVVQLSWPETRAWAARLGVDHVPDVGNPMIYRGPEDADALVEWAQSISEADDVLGADPIDDTHIREGVVLRVDEPSGSVRWLKSKSWAFGMLEGYLKDIPDYVDTEEAA